MDSSMVKIDVGDVVRYLADGSYYVVKQYVDDAVKLSDGLWYRRDEIEVIKPDNYAAEQLIEVVKKMKDKNGVEIKAGDYVRPGMEPVICEVRSVLPDGTVYLRPPDGEDFSTFAGEVSVVGPCGDDKRYKHGEIECIDAIRAALTPEEFRGFCKGNVLKYVWRERHKGGAEDLHKASDYLDWIEE